MTWRDHMRLAAASSGATVKEIRSKRRGKRIVRARQVTCWLLREMCGMSYPDIGHAIRRDHTTALHSCRAVSRDIQIGGPRAALLVDVIELAARG